MVSTLRCGVPSGSGGVPQEAESGAKRRRTDTSQVLATGGEADAMPRAVQLLQDIVQRQEQLAAKKRDVAARAPPQRPTPYVTPTGGLLQGRATSSARAPPPPPPQLPRGPGAVIGVLRGPGAVACRNVVSPFMEVKSIERAECVVVGDVGAHWDSADALAARLHGKRLVDSRWLDTNTKSGRCVAFQPTLHISHYNLFLSDSFCAAYPHHTKVLEHAAAHAPTTASGAPRLKVVRGARPDKPDHPRLSFSVWSDEEYAGRRNEVCSWNLARLISNLSVPYGRERAP